MQEIDAIAAAEKQARAICEQAKVQAAAKILETAYEIGEQGGPEEPVVKTLIGV